MAFLIMSAEDPCIGGLIYGMSAFGVAKQIKVSRTEAKQYIDDYFANYSAVAKYMNPCVDVDHGFFDNVG
jgi:DNA polymerase-1